MALDALRSTFRRTTDPADSGAGPAAGPIPMWGASDSHDPAPDPAEASRPEYGAQPPEPFLPPLASTIGWAPGSPTAAASIGPMVAESTYEPSQFKPVYADPIAGGDTDVDVFPCPSCSRTIARGTRRCD